MSSNFKFENTILSLPSLFYEKITTESFPKSSLLVFNDALCRTLSSSDPTSLSEELTKLLTKKENISGSASVAMGYAGHQFGQFSYSLGDGRAMLLGDMLDINGDRQDIHLKGIGRTPYSRQGDGRAVMGPMLREYLLGEAMHALGVPGTRGLAVWATGEQVFRETELPGAIFARLGLCHIRVGTFEYAAYRGDVSTIKSLADYCISRYYPHLVSQKNPYVEFFQAVCREQAELVARWMSIGFIHGVLNTDNIPIIQQTIDFGPCAFMDHYDPFQVYSYIDRGGRYAYTNQPSIMEWNMACLAQSLIPLFHDNVDESLAMAQNSLSNFIHDYHGHWVKMMARKCGFKNPDKVHETLVTDLLGMMAKHKADFTLTFRLLSNQLPGLKPDIDLPFTLFTTSEFAKWKQRWLKLLQGEADSLSDIREAMNQVNPIYIPRNHLLEEAFTSAEQSMDLALFNTLLDILKSPYVFNYNMDLRYVMPPEPKDVIDYTFCGT